MSHETSVSISRIGISSVVDSADHDEDRVPEAALLTDECKQEQLNYRVLISEQAIIRVRDTDPGSGFR